MLPSKVKPSDISAIWDFVMSMSAVCMYNVFPLYIVFIVSLDIYSSKSSPLMINLLTPVSSEPRTASLKPPAKVNSRLTPSTSTIILSPTLSPMFFSVKAAV